MYASKNAIGMVGGKGVYRLSFLISNGILVQDVLLITLSAATDITVVYKRIP